MKREKLGEIFFKAGLISRDALARVLEENRTHPEEKLGQTLVRLNLASDTDIARALSLQLDIPYIDLNMVVVDPYAVKQIPLDVSMKHHFLPIYIEKNNLILAMEDPQDFDAIEDARFVSSLNICPHIAALSEIVTGIERYYSVEESIGAIIQNVTPQEDVECILEHLKVSEQQFQDLKKQSESPAIVKMVNTIIFQGIAVRASAIRIEPQKQEVLVKNRVDGVLIESMRVPKWTQGSLISRIKIMGGMDFTKRHIPQKGRTKLEMQQRIIEMEMSSLPTQYGECMTIQILDTGETIPLIKDLELLPDDVTKIHKLLWLRQGMILICGPPTSGKTTTLYTLANELSRQHRKIIMLDDSIEYQLKEVQQVQIKEKDGLTYAKALDSVLRHKPDVILVGEIRDKETAEIAMNASLKGYLILSTLRTNDVMTPITRLKELDVDSQLCASSLSGIFTQRLVRKICVQCREKYEPSLKLLKNIESRLGEKLSYIFYHGKGCQTCNYTGYQDRIGVYHVVMMTRGLRKLILQSTPKKGMSPGIRKIEMILLIKNILGKVKRGITTVEELERVLFSTEESKMDGALKCEHCQQPVESDSQVCPSCHHVLRIPSPPGVEQIREPSQIASPEDAKNARYAFKGCKILLVDTDKNMIQRLRRILLEKQFTVTTATNGEEALEKIARDKPHLMITEIVMPRMDGLELIRCLRKDITTAFIPVIIVSAKGETADRLKGFAAGTDDYVPKPFSMHELFFRINAILRRTYK
jgi:type IV pilus assembly protein PilB